MALVGSGASRPPAPMAGARVSHRPMVTSIGVTYPNGRMPTSVSDHAGEDHQDPCVTKNNGPAAMSLKNESMITSVEVCWSCSPIGITRGPLAGWQGT